MSRHGTRTTGSSISASSVVADPELPMDIQIIVESRPESIHHDFDGFDSQTYKGFWLLSDEEALALESWNKLEFERQNRLFEYFINLQRIRFNMKRMVFHYGPAFEGYKDRTPNQSDDYQKTFTPIKALYEYIDKLVLKKLKPAYEGHMFVNDQYILEVSTKWFSNVAAKYDYISRGVVYLARLSASDTVREWIADVEKTDELAISNRFAPSAKELFCSYFIKLFTPLALIFKDLIKLYAKMNKTELEELAKKLDEILGKINTTSDYTADLDNKISLNEQLVCADYLYLEMVNLFDKERRLNPANLEMETKYGVTWIKCKLVLCDNYLLPLLEKKHKDTNLFLSKPPIPLQYLSYKVLEPEEKSDTLQLVIIDSGNKITHTFRALRSQKMASIMLKTFTRDLNRNRNALFVKLTDATPYHLELINGCSFVSHIQQDEYALPSDSDGHDLVKRSLDKSNEASDIKSKSARPLSTTEPSCADIFSYGGQSFIAVGAYDGIYIGQENNPASWRRVCEVARVRKLDVLDNQMMLCHCGEKLYECPVTEMMTAYTGLNLCDKLLIEIQKHCKGYELGPQKLRNGPVVASSRYLFCWKDRKIRYSPMARENKWLPIFKSMRATFNVVGMSVLYPDNFSILHFTEDMPIFYLSNLNAFTNTQMPKVDGDTEMLIRQKNQKPVGVFKFGGVTPKDYEMILVYTSYFIIVSYDSNSRTFLRSRNEIMRFNFECQEAAFDPQENALFACGSRSLEIWRIPPRKEIRSDGDARPELVTIVLGHNVKLLNKTPEKVIVSLMRGENNDSTNRLIFRVRRDGRKKAPS
ncbi:hypothetical protein FOA43_003467 [Brettanomyces nanus]|uniref:CNH domain-containing protein n=1 Tax=Eeniella nana TaxID=13502 RepID=A0A875S2Z8_EENNA|nr:uncharacterized protein FOA43_003467 [Brettanomyces nanus]QPG76081.1 hypothetical protein FOA43_003467 [Brettanomyces nanus]